MRRGWAALLTVVLVAWGFAPGMSHACCKSESAHKCCAPAVAVQTGCCDRVHEADAAAPAAERDTVTAARGSIEPEIAVSVLPEPARRLGVESRPPLIQGPPLILRI